jgi:predicted nucleotidyltransferase
LGPKNSGTIVEESGAGLAVSGLVARGHPQQDSGIDLLVEAPEGTSSFGFIRFKQLIARVLGRQIDLVPVMTLPAWKLSSGAGYQLFELCGRLRDRDSAVPRLRPEPQHTLCVSRSRPRKQYELGSTVNSRVRAGRRVRVCDII